MGHFLHRPANQPPLPQHNCADSIAKLSMAAAGGWLKAGQNPATGKGTPLDGLKGFVAVGSVTPGHGPTADGRPQPPKAEVFGVKAMVVILVCGSVVRPLCDRLAL